MAKHAVAALALLLLSAAAGAQPNTAPGWPFGAASGDVQRRVEYDRDGDRQSVNLRGQSATPTPAAANRCVMRCDATADQLQASVDGGPFVAIAGDVAGCVCAAAGANSTAIGVAAAATGGGSIAIGAGNNTNDINAICIGPFAGCDGDQSVQVGGAVSASGDPDDSVCVGYLCAPTGDNAVALGSQSTAAANTIAIGAGATASVANEAAIGGALAGITRLTIGKGSFSSSPAAVTFTTTARSGANGAGADTRIGGGQSTGTGNGGDIVLQVSVPGGAGSAQNALATAWRISGIDGDLLNGGFGALGEAANPIPTAYLDDVSTAGITAAPQGATQAVVAADTILHTTTIQSISSVGNITMSSTPTLTSGVSDQILILRNDGGFNITLQTGSSFNLRLDGGVSVTLHPGDALTLIFNSTLGDWYQLAPISHNHV